MELPGGRAGEVILSFLWCFIVGIAPMAMAQTKDPLPSWNDTPTRKAIIAFVEKVTREGSPDFVPEQERIAVFDNDGTLWSESPLYFQAFFAEHAIRKLAEQRPEWKTEEPYASVLKGDMMKVLASDRDAAIKLLATAHFGMTTEEFAQTVNEWISTAKHPKTGRPFTEMVFQPMLELLDYLRANGFKTYIVSGGGVEFMRQWAERTYGIPPEQVIGTYGKLKYEVRDGKPVLVKLPEVVLLNDTVEKPVGIQTFIGRRPIFAFGNSDGDYAMLEWVTSGKGARLGLIVHHDDAEREAAYDRDSHVGKLAKGLDDAPAKGWIITSMKKDWKVVFPPGKPSPER